MKTFENLTHDEVVDILLTAMDNGNWHTPGIGDLQIKEQTVYVVYGHYKSSLHNTYWDKEIWFNINANTVQLWEKIPQGEGRADFCQYRPIYNLKKLADIIDPLNAKKPTAEINQQ